MNRRFAVIFSLLFCFVFSYAQQENTERLRNLNDYNNVENYVKEGEYGWYFANGSLSSTASYKDNKLDGISKDFHKNGTLRRFKSYSNGKFVNGKCFDENAKEVDYYEDEVAPEFPGGKAELYKYVAQNIRKNKNDQGKMIVSFVIDQQGNPTSIMIDQGINERLDNEVKRVIKSMPKWKPGTQMGVPIRALYRLPFTLK